MDAGSINTQKAPSGSSFSMGAFFLRWWGLWLVAVTLVGVWVWMGRSLTAGRSVVVSRGPVAGILSVPGWIEPVGGIVEISTHVQGIITSIPVVPGKVVAAGDVIATLAKDEASARVMQARAAVTQAQANVRTLEAVFVALDAQARRLEAESVRLKAGAAHTPASHLSASGAPPPATAAADTCLTGNTPAQGSSSPSGSVSLVPGPSAASSLASASPDLLEAEARRLLSSLLPSSLPILLSTPESRREALASARATVELARGRLEEATTYENYTVVRAPSAGTVVRVMAEVGEQTGGLVAGPLVGLADLSRLQVRIEVDEADVTRIQTGLKAWITTPATGEQRFGAEVTQVSAEMGRRKVPLDDPRARIDTRVLEAVLSLQEPGPFKLSQRVSASIVLAPAQEVVRVPVTALVHQPSQDPARLSRLQPFVRVAGAVSPELIPVTLGRSDGDWVEVVGGVTEGQEVLLDPSLP